MKNIDIINAFIQGQTRGHVGNLTIDGAYLVNYSTRIAKRVNGKIVLNACKYSHTTSKIQNMIRRETPSNWIVEVESERDLDMVNTGN